MCDLTFLSPGIMQVFVMTFCDQTHIWCRL